MFKQLCNSIRFLLLSVVLLSLSPTTLTAKDFYFLATEDNFFVNPANWYPSYPGIKVETDDRIYIQEDVYFEGVRLELMGSLEVMLGAEMTSSDGEILIRQGGKLSNFGVIRVEGIRNFGTYTNNIGAMSQTKFYTAHRDALTDNMSSADFVVAGDAVNIGTFNNYGYCSVGHDLFSLKASVFNQIHNSELVVRGTLQSYVTSVMNHSTGSVFQITKEVKRDTSGDPGFYHALDQ